MADILAFVRNTPRTAPSGPAASTESEVLVFPRAHVRVQALWDRPDELIVAGADNRDK